MYYVYMIRCEDNSIYTGITTDVRRRLEEHKSGVGAKYTASHKVKSLEAVWKTENRSSASKLESYIKKISRAEKERIISDNTLLIGRLDIIAEPQDISEI